MDLKNAAHDALAQRGMDSDGRWVGFDAAAAHHASRKKAIRQNRSPEHKQAASEVAGHMQHLHTRVLSAAASGHIDLTHYAKGELAARGHDADGQWIGFDAAKALHVVGKQDG